MKLEYCHGEYGNFDCPHEFAFEVTVGKKKFKTCVYHLIMALRSVANTRIAKVKTLETNSWKYGECTQSRQRVS